MNEITIDAAALLPVLDAVLNSCMELDKMDDSDCVEDVWYHGEQIKRRIFEIKQMIDAARTRKG